MDIKKINKRVVVIEGLKYASIAWLGYRLGVKVGGEKFNKGLEALAMTGLTASKVINGKNYILSVTQEL